MQTGYPLFYDDHGNALQRAIDNNVHGLTFKQVASAMWPNKKPEVAYARLKSCIDPAKDEKLDLSEVALLCQVTGRVDPLYWLCDEASHGRPASISPKDKEAELQRQFIAAAQLVKHYGDKLERLTQTPLQSVK